MIFESSLSDMDVGATINVSCLPDGSPAAATATNNGAMKNREAHEVKQYRVDWRAESI